MFIPAHINVTNPPGQIVNHDLTLSDYIERKKRDDTPVKKKLTFDEWYSQSGWAACHTRLLSLDDADSAKYIMKMAWQAAQENK